MVMRAVAQASGVFHFTICAAPSMAVTEMSGVPSMAVNSWTMAIGVFWSRAPVIKWAGLSCVDGSLFASPVL